MSSLTASTAVHLRATEWRVLHGLIGQGGVVLMLGHQAIGWSSGQPPAARQWVPGAVAVSEIGDQWISVGGDAYRGAEHWVPRIRRRQAWT